MTDYEKLEHLHHAIQEIIEGRDAHYWLLVALRLVEDLREPIHNG